MSSTLKRKVVVIGGGTGSFVTLTGLRQQPDLELTTIVTMADDGGSTGRLRVALGVLPPGDMRQCFVALAESPGEVLEKFNQRIADGELKGHTIGNMLISSLEAMYTDIELALEALAKIIPLCGTIIPVTKSKVDLVAYMTSGQIIRGEDAIGSSDLYRLDRLALEPDAIVNPRAVAAVAEADVIVIAPGDIYTSIAPNLIVPGFTQALRESPAKFISICNLMTKAGHTDGYSVRTFARVLENYLQRPLDAIIYNTQRPTEHALAQYREEGEEFVTIDSDLESRFRGIMMLSDVAPIQQPGDALHRSLLRHDPVKLGQEILEALVSLEVHP